MKHINIPKIWLEEEYVRKERSMQEIAFDLNISSQTLHRILCAAGIKIRTNQYVKRLSISKEWLIEEYVNKQRSTSDIAEELNCGYNTINRRLREYNIVIRKNGKPKKDDLLGRTFGTWRVLNKSNEHNTSYWYCECTCGKRKNFTTDILIGQYSLVCTCNTDRSLLTNKRELITTYWLSLKQGAINRGLIFKINEDDLLELYEKQGRCCALTGQRLNLADTTSELKNGTQTASVDRINSLEGYTKDNIQWVHKLVNLSKSDIPQDEFIKMCNLIAKQHPIMIEEVSEIPTIIEDDPDTTSEWDSDLWRDVKAKVKKEWEINQWQ